MLVLVTANPGVFATNSATVTSPTPDPDPFDNTDNDTPPGSSVIGDRVWNDVDGDGIQDAGEGGRAGVTVTLSQGATVLGSTVTDASGNYAFPDLLAGGYTVAVTIPSGSSATTLTSQNVVLAAAQTVDTVDFGVRQTNASIGDQVWNDLNGNGVADVGEPGLSGVLVVLSQGGSTVGTATTNASGLYSFTGLAAGSYTVRVQVPAGYSATTAASQAVTLAAGQALATSDFGLRQTNAVLGDTVFEDNNGDGAQQGTEPGAPGVTVTLRQGATVVATTTTDSNGNYLFTGLAAGVYTATMTTPAGYTATTPVAATATLAAGEDRRDVDFGIRAPGALIGDLVFADLDADGAFDAGEPGVAGVTVTLRQGATVVATAVTDLDGLYSFPGLAANTYSVTMTVPSGYTATTVVTRSVTVVAGQTVTTADFGLDPGASIGDLVWIDLDADGVRDPLEVGLAGATVTLRQGTTVMGTAVTDAAGAYTFTGLAAGSYTVTLTPPAGYGATTANPVAVTLSTGQNVTTADIGARLLPASIGDTVFDDLDGDGVQLLGEPGYVGATITLFSGATPLASTTSGAAGAYLFSGLAPGTYTVAVTVPTGYGATTVTSRTVTVAGGDAVTTADFGIRQLGATIGDRVWSDLDGDGTQDGGETGLSGATVTLSLGATVIGTATTGATGAYSFSSLAPGTYTVAVTLPAGYSGSTALSRSVIVAAGEVRNDIDFGGVQPAVIGDLVWTDSNGDGLFNGLETGLAGVTLTLSQGATTLGTTVSGSGGAYSFGSLVAGTYTVTVTPPAGHVATTPSSFTLTVAAGASNTTADFGVQGRGSVTGVVFADENGNGTQDVGELGLAGVSVVVGSQTVVTDGTGAYSASDVPAGSVSVNVVEASLPAGSVQTAGVDPSTVTVVAGATADAGVDGFQAAWFGDRCGLRRCERQRVP